MVHPTRLSRPWREALLQPWIEGRRTSPLRQRTVTPCPCLDRAEQVLPRFIEGLCALQLQVCGQMFEIDSRFSKVVQNSFALSSIARESSGQFAMIGKGRKSAGSIWIVQARTNASS
jgi:hypothetical protein